MLPLLAAALHGSCVDESGSPVDWWFLLKHPRWSTSTSKKTHCIGDCKGDTYVWVSSVSSAGWQTGAAPVTSADSLLGKQLAGIYDGTIPNYAFYNDQLPNGSWSEVYGHSKGFLGYTNDSAFWVQHSIPKFPNYKKDGYEYQTGELWYGQHAFCMTLTKEALNEIGSAMSYASRKCTTTRFRMRLCRTSTLWPPVSTQPRGLFRPPLLRSSRSSRCSRKRPLLMSTCWTASWHRRCRRRCSARAG